jgi:hypothetical protein
MNVLVNQPINDIISVLMSDDLISVRLINDIISLILKIDYTKEHGNESWQSSSQVD